MIEAKCVMCGNHTECGQDIKGNSVCPICAENFQNPIGFDAPLHTSLAGRSTSDGSTADYYELPPNARELQDLISFRNMNGQIAEIFRACYRYGLASHSATLRDAKKIQFYANAEVNRLETYGE